MLFIFNFLKLSKKNNSRNRKSSNESYQRDKYLEAMKEIEEKKFVNDKRTKELYGKLDNLTKNALIDRHFYYNNVIDYYYGLRDKEIDAIDKCIHYCKEDIKITPQVLNLMKSDKMFKHYNEEGKLVFTPPRFPSFQRLAIIYDSQGKYQEAINVCKKAIKHNLKDGTKTGFEGRIKRLEKKLY